MNRLPHPDEILAFLRDNPGQTGKREIARAFGLKGAAKVELKQLLAEMTRDGAIAREAPPRVAPAGRAAAGAGAAGHRRRRRRRPLGRAGRVGGRRPAPRASSSAPAATTRRSAPATGCSAG